MTKIFKEKQIIKIVPQDIEQACNMQIIKVTEDCLTADAGNNQNDLSGNAECFAVAESGIVYFQSKIEKINDNKFKIPLPPAQKILQRREYSRIEFHSPVTFKTNKSEIQVQTTDISAGGMQIISDCELAMSEDYEFSMALDKNRTINAFFAPIRQDKTEDNKYLISGKFKVLTNKDRISLVQFCFTKQMENTNK